MHLLIAITHEGVGFIRVGPHRDAMRFALAVEAGAYGNGAPVNVSTIGPHGEYMAPHEKERKARLIRR